MLTQAVCVSFIVPMYFVVSLCGWNESNDEPYPLIYIHTYVHAFLVVWTKRKSIEKQMFAFLCHCKLHYRRSIVFHMTEPTIKQINSYLII